MFSVKTGILFVLFVFGGFATRVSPKAKQRKLDIESTFTEDAPNNPLKLGIGATMGVAGLAALSKEAPLKTKIKNIKDQLDYLLFATAKDYQEQGFVLHHIDNILTKLELYMSKMENKYERRMNMLKTWVEVKFKLISAN